jgi:LacI family transcriptional regulator
MRRHASAASLGRIAEEAGVSRATVSMALRNHPRIPAATRDRVQAIATRLGWKPNPLLAEVMTAIRAGQPPADRVTLAWITAHPRRDGWQRVPFFNRCFEGARNRAAAAGYRLEHFWLGDADGNAARLGDILLARGITGLVVSPLPRPESIPLPWDKFSSVSVAYTLIGPRLHRATDNHCASARLAVACLHAAGKRRIGLALTTDYHQRVNGLWTAGYLLEMQASGLVDDSLIYRPEELHEAALLAWVKRAKVDAIVGTEPAIAGWLRRANLKVPAQVAYADLNLAAPDGSVAGIYQDATSIGACAVDLLAGQLLRHERGLPEKAKTLMIDSRWVNGATAPRIPEEDTLHTSPAAPPPPLHPLPVPFD